MFLCIILTPARLIVSSIKIKMNHSWNYSWIKRDAMPSCLYLLFSPSYLSMLVVVKSVVLLLERYIVSLHVLLTLKHYETVSVFKFVEI